MNCPRCGNQVADGIKFCGVCGSPMPASQIPPPQQPQNPYGAPPPGQYVPPPQGGPQGGYIPPSQYEEYANSMFGNAVPKAELHNPKGPLRVADMTITIDGELVPVVDIMLGNQLPIYFEHHILLWKHPGVRMDVTTVAGSQRGGGLMGAIGGLVAGASIVLNRFTGPGRIGIQSMSYHPPVAEGAQQAGGQSNIDLGQFFS